MATTQITEAESSIISQPSFLNNHSHQCAYDVFLSFRGDTRKTFTDHLYFSLRQAGINTFRDEEEVRKGETLSYELKRAIQSSKVSVIVFSKGYASSRWCLDELVEILECKETKEQNVLPVFYDVEPSEVRKQTGEFGVALAKHEECFGEEKVKRWRDALKKAGELSGWDLQQVANGYESKLINAIIKEVLSKVGSVPMFVAKYEVGLDSRVEHVVWLMNKDIGDEVRLIGLYGMGGIGKTTLVKAVYNHVFEFFDSRCFLEIRSRVVDQHNNGIIALQQELLRQLLLRKLEISNVDEGMMLIKKRLQGRKCLIVLDDLDHLHQLEALAGERNWFGPGSRVILTTRDKHILKDLEVDERYMVKELNDEHSLQLFNLHTFKSSKPPKDYTKLSMDIVSYCGGLPLALQVLGAYLSDKQKQDWSSALERLKKIPSNEVHAKLKISFDGLPSNFTKGVFLDLACCLPQVIHKKTAITMLEAPGNFPHIEIQDLIDKSLISIDKYDCLRMHSLIREMGREIVHSESPNNPGERSRLCCANEIGEVLLNHTGTTKVEAIMLDESMPNMFVDTKAFKEMTNLRLLLMNHLRLHGSFKYLPRKLRVLQWNYCPSKYIPSDFHSENLVILRIENSNIKEFRAPLKNFPSMKSLSFNRSKHLTRTPNFMGAQLLENLSFYGCSRLVDVHSSIGELGRLNVAFFDWCGKLKKLPKSIVQLKSLKTLSVDSCPKLRLPDELGRLTSLKRLCIGDFSGITTSSAALYLPSSLTSLYSLKILDVRGRNLLESHIPMGLESLSLLKFLELSGSHFQCFPLDLSQFSKLECIQLDFCNNLKMLPRLPPGLRILRARVCESLEKIPNLSNLKLMEELDLFGCKNLLAIDGLEYLDSIQEIGLMNCSRITTPFPESFFKRQAELHSQHLEDLKLKVAYPNNEIPSWFSFQEVGSSISFQLPLYNKSHDNKLEFLVLILWLVWVPTTKYDHYFDSTHLRYCQYNDGTDHMGCELQLNGETSSTCYLTLDRLASLGMIDKREIMDGRRNMKIDVVDVDDAISVKKIGVHALYVTNKDFEGDNMISENSENYRYLDLKIRGHVDMGATFKLESLVLRRRYFS